MRKCKDVVWNCWMKEYYWGLCECYIVIYKVFFCGVEKGDVCFIKDDNKDRNKWKFGIVEELIEGCDGVVRVVKF